MTHEHSQGLSLPLGDYSWPVTFMEYVVFAARPRLGAEWIRIRLVLFVSSELGAVHCLAIDASSVVLGHISFIRRPFVLPLESPRVKYMVSWRFSFVAPASVDYLSGRHHPFEATTRGTTTGNHRMS